MLGAALVEAERGIARRFASEIETRLSYFKADKVKRGLKKSETIDPELLPSQMTFRWAPATIPVANLSAWLDDHASSRALAIVLPLLAEARDSGA
jgi:hypothetical protein